MGTWETVIINLSDLAAKREFLLRLGRLRGVYEIRLKERRRVRSNQQNAWYWACIVSSAAAVFSDIWGEEVKSSEAHETLKDTLLSEEKIHLNEETGEVRTIRRMKSSAKLDTGEFSEYCERCRDFLAGFGVIVPDPGDNE